MRSDPILKSPLAGRLRQFFSGGHLKDYSPKAGLVDWDASLLLRADVGSSSRVT